MKKILILLLVLATYKVSAQVDTSTYSKKVDYLFQNISQVKFTGSVLYDRAMPVVDLQYFGTEKYNTSSRNHWEQAYYELQIASNQLNHKLHLDKVLTHKVLGTIPVGIISTNMHYLDSMAIKNSILVQNAPNMPYKQVKEGTIFKSSQLFVGAILNEKPLIANKSYSLEFSRDFLFMNNEKNISNIEVAIADRKISIIPPYYSNTIKLSFSKVGTKTITFSISYKNGTKTTTYATIEVENDISTTARAIGDPCYIPPAVPGAGFGGNIEATIPFTGYESGDLPILGRGDVGYYYSSNSANLKPCNETAHNVTKPIIFLDGFDALDKRDIPTIYKERLIYAGGNFGDDIRGQGYDLVILNFPNYITSNYTRVDGGTDYIERNAMVLVALIQNIKAQLVAAGSTEQITIVGPSMGGLISRYALAYMEKNGLNHNTKLWISFDSPHNGANIPIGSQKLLESLSGTFTTAATKLETKLNNVATRQLLLSHYSSPVDKQNWYRNTFVANLTSNGLAGSNGFPKNLRKVALINGTLSGLEYYGNASGDYMNIVIKKRSLFSLFGLLKHGLEFLTFFAPANNTVGKVRETKVHISGLLGLQAGQGNATAYNGFASIDKVQGGWFNSSQEILDGFKSESIPFLGEISGNVSYPNLCFIPSKSGLAYTGTNTNFSEVMHNRSLVCSGETPFDAYYAPSTNEDHTSIGAGGAAWLNNELAGIPNQNLPTSNNNGASFTASISGSNATVCPNTPTTYTLNTSIPLPAGSTINWTVPDDVTFIGQGTSQITITLPATRFFFFFGVYWNNEITAEVKIPSYCEPALIVKKEINLSTELPSGYGNVAMCEEFPTSNGMIELDFFSATQINVSVLDVITGAVLSSYISYGRLLSLPVGRYSVILSNGCITNPPEIISVGNITCVPAPLPPEEQPPCVIFTDDGYGYTPCKIKSDTKKSEITVSPNPANTYLDVSNILAGSEVKIYTKIGVLLLSEKSENDKIRLDISKLNTDLYILEAVLPNNIRVRKQIVKE